MTTEAIEVKRPVYTLSLVCPLCHQPLSFPADGVTTCPHCKVVFRVTTAAQVGPSETKAARDE